MSELGNRVAAGLVAGALLIVGVATVHLSDGSGGGSPPGTLASSRPTAPTAPGAVTPHPLAAAPSARDALRLPDAAGDRSAGREPPVRLRIPALHVDAPVRPVGDIDLPSGATTLGWLVGSAVPGARTGTTVIVGPAESSAPGMGSLSRLDRVAVGTSILVASADGTAVRYRVTGLHGVSKTDGLPRNAVDRGGPPRLTLVVSGSSIDGGTHRYLELMTTRE